MGMLYEYDEVERAILDHIEHVVIDPHGSHVESVRLWCAI